jgi:hypothetical protein
MDTREPSPSTPDPLAPPAPATPDEPLRGYLQITFGRDGTVALRGSRLLCAWLLRELAAQGWVIDLDNIHWCG